MTTKYLLIFNLGSIQKFSFLIQRFYVWLNVFIKLLFPEKKRKLTCGDFCLTETQCKRRCAGKDTKLNSYILQKSFFFSWGYELYLIQRTQEIKKSVIIIHLNCQVREKSKVFFRSCYSSVQKLKCSMHKWPYFVC